MSKIKCEDIGFAHCWVDKTSKVTTVLTSSTPQVIVRPKSGNALIASAGNGLRLSNLYAKSGLTTWLPQTQRPAMTDSNPPAPTKALREEIREIVAWIMDIQTNPEMDKYSNGISRLEQLITSKVRQGQIQSVTSALTACPTKDHMLRLWLEQHLRALKEQEG
jgi:hypothetical protein